MNINFKKNNLQTAYMCKVVMSEVLSNLAYPMSDKIQSFQENLEEANFQLEVC